MAQRISAGLVLYRVQAGRLEVLLAHPGGPCFAHKDDGHWTIPKGETHAGEDLLATARREFQEEIGVVANGDFRPLGFVDQKGGKRVHAWAFAGEYDDSQPPASNAYELEWPPGSGSLRPFPEVDRARFFSLAEARIKLKDRQRPFLDRLEALLGEV